MIFLLLPFLFILNVAPAFAISSQYDIEATLDSKISQIEGSVKITLTHPGAEALPAIYLLLYPNIYSEKTLNIRNPYYKKAYPVQFNPGGMQITAVSNLQGDPLPFSLEPSRKNTVLKVIPNPAIPPSGRYEFLIKFLTKIPEKYGVFGQYKNLTTLQGGWHPVVAAFVKNGWNLSRPPDPGHYRVRLTVSQDVHPVASLPLTNPQERGPHKSLLYEGVLPFFSLAIGRNVILLTQQVGPVTLNYQVRPQNQIQAKKTLNITEEATRYFLEQRGPLPATSLQMAEAYLHQDLTGIGSNMLYISTTIFKVLSPLKRFHSANIAKGIFLLLWQAKLPEEETWVIEGLAQRETDQFMETRYHKKSSLEAQLKPFSFIPFVDDVLYSKEIPLRKIYFKEFTPTHFNEEFRLFTHPRPQGTPLFSKLTHLLGELTLEEITRSYLEAIHSGERPLFRNVASQHAGKALDEILDAWIDDNPVIDFGIEQVTRSRGDGHHQTSFTISKRGEGMEPVKIRIQEKSGQETWLSWDGQEKTYQGQLLTPSRIQTIEVDPHHQSSDPNRFNNQTPVPWKLLLNRLKIDYDVNTQKTGYSASLLYQPIYDKRRRVALTFSKEALLDFTRLEYSHVLKNQHRVTAGASYVTPLQPPGGDYGMLHLAYTLSYPDIPLISDYIQKLAGRYPNLNLTFELTRQITGHQEEHLFTTKIDLRRNFIFSNYHEVATRFFIGESSGDLLKGSRFFLGGDGEMRGYPSLGLEGDNIGLISVEYRFPIRHETEYYVEGVALTHTLQGAFFMDAGQVTDSRNVFEFYKYQFDIGFGLRWSIDLLGFYPILLRTDIASPLPWSGSEKMLYYISVGQPF